MSLTQDNRRKTDQKIPQPMGLATHGPVPPYREITLSPWPRTEFRATVHPYSVNRSDTQTHDHKATPSNRRPPLPMTAQTTQNLRRPSGSRRLEPNNHHGVRRFVRYRSDLSLSHHKPRNELRDRHRWRLHSRVSGFRLPRHPTPSQRPVGDTQPRAEAQQGQHGELCSSCPATFCGEIVCPA